MSEAAAVNVEGGGEPVARFARVAPPLPVEGLFTYSIPERLAERVVPGVRAVVPFGRRKLHAMVVAVDGTAPPTGVDVKPLEGLLETEPLAGPDILALAEWVAATTGCSVGEALDAALPRAVKIGQAARTVPLVELAVDRRAVPALVDDLQAKRDKQARALRILEDRGGELPLRELMQLAHVSRSPVDSLAKAGLVRIRRVSVRHDPLLGRRVERQPPLELTDDQRAVFERIVATVDGDVSRTFLLHGVTGSGKTEVYLQVLDHVVRSGRQGIVLVPEISLTPQTVRRFRERFDRVAVLHSHLTDAERHDQWRRIRGGEADVVVGARSAVFAPVPRLGVVVLDEEHETSFKQHNVPRYHARDVAIERARLAGAVTILGTATPSLEAYRRAEVGTYERLVLSERVAGGRTPEVAIIDLTVEERRKGNTFLTDRMRAAVDDALSRGGQVILFLNRRGWATVMLCRTCRVALRCPDCDVSMTLHRRIDRMLCHYCGHEEPTPRTCPTCGQRPAPLGFGTEKVENEVRQSFPGVSVARMDSDTMSGRGAHESVLDGFAKGHTRVLVGTQMIAKGLDFPNTTLVGVICADSALFLPDYRAAERTFQLLAQVTGRTGRGPKGGRVVVQAYNPQHFAIRTGVAQDYEAFARRELAERAELGYPPFGRLVRVVAQGPELAAVTERAARLAQILRDDPPEAEEPESPTLFASSAVDGGDGAPSLFPSPGAEARQDGPPFFPSTDAAGEAERPWQVLGPAPAPIPRINRQHRAHLVVKCTHDDAVSDVLARLAGQTQPARKVRVLVDVDPISML